MSVERQTQQSPERAEHSGRAPATEEGQTAPEAANADWSLPTSPRGIPPADPTSRALRQRQIRQIQQVAGNRAVQRRLQQPPVLMRCGCEVHAGCSCAKGADEEETREPIQRKPLESARIAQREEEAPAADTAEAGETLATSALIVDDDTETAGDGQMKKSEFLAQLREAVTSTANEALAPTGRTADDCPYIEQAFAYYAGKDAQHIERALRKYATDAAGAATAQDYIPIVAVRVRQGVDRWAATGEVSGVPEEMSGAVGMLGGLAAGIGGALSALGNLLFKRRDGGSRADAGPRKIQTRLGEGRGLDAPVKSRMETAFGHDFSDVRVHTDGAASALSSQLNARAFAVGTNVAFGAGEYQPGTPIGDALIAHELAHVVQQRGAGAAGIMSKSDASETELETDADTSAVYAVAALWGGVRGELARIGKNALPELKSGLRLQRCTGEKCPEGYSWTVTNRAQVAGACDCTWQCRTSDGPAFTDPNRRVWLPSPRHTVGVGGGLPGRPGECACMPLKDSDGNIIGNSWPGQSDQDYTGAAQGIAGARDARYRPPQTTDPRPVPAEVRPATPSGGTTPAPTTPATPGGGTTPVAPANPTPASPATPTPVTPGGGTTPAAPTPAAPTGTAGGGTATSGTTITVSGSQVTVTSASGTRTLGTSDLSSGASAPDRGGLTLAGRALQKHGGRTGSAFPAARGKPADINQAGQQIVDDILANGSVTTRQHGRFGPVIEVTAPDGRGLRYDANGKLIGFLEP